VAALTEEVTGLRNMKEISTLELKHMHEENKSLAADLKKQLNESSSLSRAMDEVTTKNQDLKVTLPQVACIS
jgi:hypothetical protein